MSERSALTPQRGMMETAGQLAHRVAQLEARKKWSSVAYFNSSSAGGNFFAEYDPPSWPNEADFVLLHQQALDPGSWVAFAYVSNMNGTADDPVRMNFGMQVRLSDGVTSATRRNDIETRSNVPNAITLSGICQFQSDAPVTVSLHVFGATFPTSPPLGNGTIYYSDWGLWVLPT